MQFAYLKSPVMKTNQMGELSGQKLQGKRLCE
jgi:hypothetical protein